METESGNLQFAWLIELFTKWEFRCGIWYEKDVHEIESERVSRTRDNGASKKAHERWRSGLIVDEYGRNDTDLLAGKEY